MLGLQCCSGLSHPPIAGHRQESICTSFGRWLSSPNFTGVMLVQGSSKQGIQPTYCVHRSGIICFQQWMPAKRTYNWNSFFIYQNSLDAGNLPTHSQYTEIELSRVSLRFVIYASRHLCRCDSDLDQTVVV